MQYNTTLHRFVINTTWDSSELHFCARGDEDLEVARDAVRGTVLLAWSGKLDRQEEHNFYHNNETPLVLYFHTPCDNADGV